jgi:hypothetical protein
MSFSVDDDDIYRACTIISCHYFYEIFSYAIVICWRRLDTPSIFFLRWEEFILSYSHCRFRRSRPRTFHHYTIIQQQLDIDKVEYSHATHTHEAAAFEVSDVVVIVVVRAGATTSPFFSALPNSSSSHSILPHARKTLRRSELIHP